MKSAIALRHLAFEHMGVWEGLLKRRGYRLDYVDASSADLSSFDASTPDLMVVLGGPIGACDERDFPFLRDELRLIEARLAVDKPLLGICLGAQLIARIFGAEVKPMAEKEIGFSPLRLTEEGTASSLGTLTDMPVLHWHGDMFALPEGATLLASTDICPNQAFSVGDGTLGLQFHLEADSDEIEQWLVGHSAELRAAGVDIAALRRDAANYGPELARRAANVLDDWLDRAEIER